MVSMCRECGKGSTRLVHTARGRELEQLEIGQLSLSHAVWVVSAYACLGFLTTWTSPGSWAVSWQLVCVMAAGGFRSCVPTSKGRSCGACMSPSQQSWYHFHCSPWVTSEFQAKLKRISLCLDGGSCKVLELHVGWGIFLWSFVTCEVPYAT